MGKLLVIDGLDGSGKTTQVELLIEKLNDMGYKAIRVKFPAYENESSTLIKMYLGGRINKDASKINPYAASIFYAADRYIAFQTNLQYFENSSDETILVCDRYISANIIHQGGKIDNKEEQAEYYKWCYELETERLKIPKEAKTIMLLLKPEISASLLSKRYNNNESLKDIHENNIEYLEQCYKSAVYAAQYNNWETVDCGTNTGEIRDKQEIHEDILKIVKEIL